MRTFRLDHWHKIVVATVALLAIVCCSAISAQAAEITVTTTRDEISQNGNCSLREAILAANDDAAVDACSAGEGTDTLILGAGTYRLEIEGIGDDRNLTGDLDVRDDLLIIGSTGAESTVIDAQEIDRVLHIEAGVRIGLSGLTIRNGFVGGSNGLGGALLAEAGAVSLSNMRFVDNSAGRGGAVYTNNTLTVRNSSFADNQAGEGGAIYHAARGKAEIVNSLFTNNQAQKGAVYFLASGALASVNLLHITVASDAQQPGNAIEINGGTASIVNTILTGYETGLQANAGTLQSHHNLFFDLSTVMTGKGTLIDNGYNLIGKSPNFVDPAHGDYRLGNGSAALHQGKAMGVLTDFFGTLRPRTSGVDLGFAQTQTSSVALVVRLLNFYK